MILGVFQLLNTKINTAHGNGNIISKRYDLNDILKLLPLFNNRLLTSIITQFAIPFHFNFRQNFTLFSHFISLIIVMFKDT